MELKLKDLNSGESFGIHPPGKLRSYVKNLRRLNMQIMLWETFTNNNKSMGVGVSPV